MCWRTTAECRRPSGPATRTREPVDIIGMSEPGGGIVVECGAISPDALAELSPPETTDATGGAAAGAGTGRALISPEWISPEWISPEWISPDACGERSGVCMCSCG